MIKVFYGMRNTDLSEEVAKEILYPDRVLDSPRGLHMIGHKISMTFLLRYVPRTRREISEARLTITHGVQDNMPKERCDEI